MKKTRSWFPTLIYSELLDNFLLNNSYLVDKAYFLRDRQNKVKTYWNCKTFNTLGNYDFKLDNDDIVNELVKLVKDKTLIFSKKFGVDENLSLVCDDLWFNISSPGDYQEFHNHAGSHFSLVYYISVFPDSGDIVFANHYSLVDMFPLPVKDYTYASFNSCFYTPKNGMLLIFRSNLPHMVKQNLSEFDRISISMNFKFIQNAI
jgi:uncharacterized protein (TIGR02466 family)